MRAMNEDAKDGTYKFLPGTWGSKTKSVLKLYNSYEDVLADNLKWSEICSWETNVWGGRMQWSDFFAFKKSADSDPLQTSADRANETGFIFWHNKTGVYQYQ